MVTNRRDQEVDTLLEQTELSRPQINLLLTMSDFLVFAESVSQQEIHIFVQAESGFLAIKDGGLKRGQLRLCPFGRIFL